MNGIGVSRVTTGVRAAREWASSTYLLPRLVRPGSYRALLRDALSSVSPDEVRTLPPPSWPVDPVQGSSLTIRWPAADRGAHWTTTIREGLASQFELKQAPIEQAGEHLTVFEVELGSQTHACAIDFADTRQVDDDVARRVAAYFKLQYDDAGYRHASIVPGGYVVGAPRLYSYLERLRRRRDAKPPLYDVYGRFSPHSLDERGATVARLEDQTRFTFHGGFGLVLYGESMREVASARICVDTPGRGPLCFRLIDYLAVGSCVVAYPHHARLPMPLRDGVDVVYLAADGSDILDVCESLLADEPRRLRMVQASREYFDRYLHPRQLGSYYVKTILERMN